MKIITYVLDDDREELEILQEYLSEVCGCNLEMYTDVGKFIDAIAKSVHIAIIDHQLGAGFDGITVGEMALEKNPFLFLILFSGSPSPKVWQRAANSGFRRLVDKNEPGSYQLVADLVRKEIPAIERRVNAWENLQTLNDKYKQYLPA